MPSAWRRVQAEQAARVRVQAAGMTRGSEGGDCYMLSQIVSESARTSAMSLLMVKRGFRSYEWFMSLSTMRLAIEGSNLRYYISPLRHSLLHTGAAATHRSHEILAFIYRYPQGSGRPVINVIALQELD